MLKAHIRQRDR